MFTRHSVLQLVLPMAMLPLLVGCAGWSEVRQMRQELALRKSVNDAFRKEKPVRSGNPTHFSRGWRQAYYNVSKGSDTCPPSFPPAHYWHSKYQNADGKRKIASWFEGYSCGAAAAVRDGRQHFNTVPFTVYCERESSYQCMPVPTYHVYEMLEVAGEFGSNVRQSNALRFHQAAVPTFVEPGAMIEQEAIPQMDVPAAPEAIGPGEPLSVIDEAADIDEHLDAASRRTAATAGTNRSEAENEVASNVVPPKQDVPSNESQERSEPSTEVDFAGKSLVPTPGEIVAADSDPADAQESQNDLVVTEPAIETFDQPGRSDRSIVEMAESMAEAADPIGLPTAPVADKEAERSADDLSEEQELVPGHAAVAVADANPETGAKSLIADQQGPAVVQEIDPSLRETYESAADLLSDPAFTDWTPDRNDATVVEADDEADLELIESIGSQAVKNTEGASDVTSKTPSTEMKSSTESSTASLPEGVPNTVEFIKNLNTKEKGSAPSNHTVARPKSVKPSLPAGPSKVSVESDVVAGGLIEAVEFDTARRIDRSLARTPISDDTTSNRLADPVTTGTDTGLIQEVLQDPFAKPRAASGRMNSELREPIVRELPVRQRSQREASGLIEATDFNPAHATNRSIDAGASGTGMITQEVRVTGNVRQIGHNEPKTTVQPSDRDRRLKRAMGWLFNGK